MEDLAAVLLFIICTPFGWVGMIVVGLVISMIRN